MQPITLFCLPYAGGAAAVYREWPKAAPAWLHIAPLHLPGRGLRHDQALLPDWAPLIDRLVADVQPHLERPFALFGHSLGALLAFELAHALRRRFGVEPRWLGVSGCPAPSHHVAETDWLTCNEQDVLDELTAFGQTAPELLANREFVELIVPVVRNDFHLYGTWRAPGDGARSPLDCALHAFGGRHDEFTQDPAMLDAWRSESRGRFQCSAFDGGHFFIDSHRAELIDAIAASLRDAPASLPQLKQSQQQTHADMQPIG
jgi:surfactin synthase thioesterase subunit